MFERRIEPHTGKAVFADHVAIPLNRPGTAAQRQYSHARPFKSFLKVPRFYRSVSVDPARVDDLGDPAMLVRFDKQVKVEPLAMQKVGKMPGDARFADAHETGQGNP